MDSTDIWDTGVRVGVIPGCMGGVGYRDTEVRRTVRLHRDTWDPDTHSPLLAQCSWVSTTSTILTSVHVFSESTLTSNSALETGPAVVSTALRREVQVGGIPLHRPLCQICNAFSPPISLCIKDSTSTKRTPRLMGSFQSGTSSQTASNPTSDGV